VDPVLPSGWEEADVRLRFRGRRLRIRADHDATRVDADGEVTVATADGATSRGCSLRLARGPGGWRLRR
jgi:trehalose/maltose hydrolase-like predicted phosphorylase